MAVENMMKVSAGLDLATMLVHSARPIWKEAGNIETAILARKLEHIRIDKPVFITGLARAGSTLMLEFLASQKNVATHQYRDFPFIFTPYLSRKFTRIFSSATIIKKERAHGDGIFVSPQSPEGMEEMLWQAFKKQDEIFAAFYRAHIRKLLLAERAEHYVAKNNNLAGRIPALLAILPDARIIVPVRDPVSHIGSLKRQHEKFLSEANSARAVRHLRAQGHFEFGPTRNWTSSNEIDGWIQQWNNTYRLLAQYRDHPQFLFVRFEALCDAPDHWLYKIGRHAAIAIDADRHEIFTRSISEPNYYKSGFSDAEITHIRVCTAEINGYFTGTMIG
jgi:hypothetical protein